MNHTTPMILLLASIVAREAAAGRYGWARFWQDEAAYLLGEQA